MQRRRSGSRPRSHLGAHFGLQCLRFQAGSIVEGLVECAGLRFQNFAVGFPQMGVAYKRVARLRGWWLRHYMRQQQMPHAAIPIFKYQCPVGIKAF